MRYFYLYGIDVEWNPKQEFISAGRIAKPKNICYYFCNKQIFGVFIFTDSCIRFSGGLFMKRGIQKTTAVLLVILFITSSLAFSAAALETYNGIIPDSGKTGDCTWTLDENGVPPKTKLTLLPLRA